MQGARLVELVVVGWMIAWPAIGVAEVPQAERDALIAVYHSTDGDNWINNEGWRGPEGTECTWYGVRCDVAGTAVTQLRLNDNGLSGNIPPELGNLGSLTHLVLYANELSGSIPPELGELNTLEHLALNENELTGSIPPELGDLDSLKGLGLFSNHLSGRIPSELGNLSDLMHLVLNGNELSGSIPPELGNLSRLDVLMLHSNRLSGGIPPELGSLGSLRNLRLNDNRLTGSIPPELGNLVSWLFSLDLHSNQLSGSIPPELGSLGNLRYLDLSENQLSGSIPPQVGNLHIAYFVSLARNRLTGLIPFELGRLEWLTTLQLQSNHLSGSVPDALQNLRRLGYGSGEGIDLRWNALWTDDPELTEFLASKQVDGDWESTQTVIPQGATASAIDQTSVEVSWEPIRYAWDPGFYQVSMRDAATGTYHVVGRTPSKRDSSLIVNGLRADTTYDFVVLAVTEPHPWNDNRVTSERSDSVSVTTPAAPLCTVSCSAAGPVTATVGEELGYSGDITVGVCDEGTTVLWAFGDGETSTAQSPAHAYFFPGTYAWQMTASAGGSSCTSAGTTVVTSPDAECGNGVCETGETAWSCPSDCGLETDETGLAGESATEHAVPAAVGGVRGEAGTFWVSEAMIFNPTSESASYTVEFTPDRRPGRPAHAGPLTLGAGEAVFWSDFVGELFDDDRNGSVLVSANRPVMLSTRVFNDQPEGSYGQRIGAVRVSRAFGPGAAGYLIGLSVTPEYRSNVLFQEVSGRAAEVKLWTFTSSGTVLGTTTIAVPAGAKVQQSMRGLGIAEFSNGYTRFEVSGGQVVVIGSVVDNRTGDAVTLDALHPEQGGGNSQVNADTADQKSSGVDFGWSPEYPEPGMDVQFEDRTPGRASGWSWDFGDSGTSNEQHPTHSYLEVGNYTVVLTAARWGVPQIRTRKVTVIDPSSDSRHSLVPVVAHLRGSLGTQWRSDLVLMNPFDRSQQVRLEYLPVGGNGPLITQREVRPGEVLALVDVVGTLYSAAGEGKGSLHLYAPHGVFATSRTYHLGPEGTYGQAVLALGGGDLIAAEERAWLLKLKHSDRSRCNLGLTAFDDLHTRVRVTLYGRNEGDMELLGARFYRVDALQHRQIDEFIVGMGVTEELETVIASVEVTSGGRVYAYASNVDNRTGDAEFIPAIRE